MLQCITILFCKGENSTGRIGQNPSCGSGWVRFGAAKRFVRCLEDTWNAVLEKIWHWIGPPTPYAATKPISGTSVNQSSDAIVEPIY